MADAAPTFDIHIALQRIEAAIAPFSKAALFELYDRGYSSLFEQLVACIISIRTYDEVTVPAAVKLFSLARRPAEMAVLEPSTIEEAIEPASYAGNKAYQIKDIAAEITGRYSGELPPDFEVLTGFKGVGPKCAGLSLGIAAGQAYIGVDVHVHRVTNRWGYVETKNPEKTRQALQEVLPPKYWLSINRLLVPFGKHICTGRLPHCSSCPVEDMCRQVGVSRHR
jgi:endonuclease-3